MRTLTTFALATLLATGCENVHSKLDDMPKPGPVATGQAKAADPGAAQVAVPALPSNASVEERVARLEAMMKKYEAPLDFLAKVYAQQEQQAKQQQREEPAEDAVFAVDVSNDVKAGQVDGPADAPVTIVKAFDFACPYCQKVSGTMDELVKDYGGKVRVVYKNMVVHPQVAQIVHVASCAAAKQGKYLQFKNAFWDKGFGPYIASQGKDHSAYTDEGIAKIAGDIGLDVGKLKSDMASDDCKKLVSDDMSELAKFHVNSTPTFFINGQHVGGALPKEAFKQIIDEKLKVAEASGVSGADYYSKEVVGKGEKQFRSKMDPKPN